MDKINGRLENWGLYIVNDTIWANIYDDPDKRWEDGHYIKTSRVIEPEIDELREGDIIKTKNSTYLLGKKLKETMKVYRVEFKFKLDDMVTTILGDKGIITMLGVDDSGDTYYVKMSTNSDWYKPSQLTISNGGK